MTKQKIRENTKDLVQHECSISGCGECHYFEPEDDTDGEYFCGIRDKDNKIPYYTDWDMSSAMGM